MARPLTDADTLGLVCAEGVIPVIAGLAPERADRLGSALKDGRLPIAEVTLRSQSALEALRRLAADPELIVGAGTVIRPEQVELAAAAGARFVVSPGISESVIRRSEQLGLPVIPGVSTSTEIISALDLGCDVLKFFPAEASGGVGMIAALEAPFPDVRFIPTGGLTAENASTYFSRRSVVAVGGSWMVTPALDGPGDFAEVTRRTSEAVSLVAAARRWTI
jgi:2-dehydro-3-deoxyphosphogluconate aldolase/(4S)-4-hydroxy-2-oxoglutarate aldolase